MTVTDCFCQNCMTWNHEKYQCVCIGQNIDQNSVTFADLSKELEILGVNTENKFNFNSSIKIVVEKLVSYSVTSLGWPLVLITIINNLINCWFKKTTPFKATFFWEKLLKQIFLNDSTTWVNDSLRIVLWIIIKFY